MTVTDFTFPQSGDADYFQNFGTWLGRSNITDYVEEGMSVSISDASAPEITITEGKAFLSEAQNTISANSETRLTLDYCIIRPQTTIGSSENLTDGQVNYVVLRGNFGSNDSPEYYAYQSEGSVSAEELLIAEVDLTNDTVTERSRDTDISVEEGIFSVNLGVPVYSDSSNAVSGEGNLIYIDGGGSQDSGLYLHDGSSYSKVGLERIAELDDVTGITGLEENSSGNRPTAGTEGRIFFNTTDNTVEYDTGSTWQVIGIDPAQISAGDLGFDPATQTELDNHTATGDAHHSKTTTIDDLTDVDLTDIEVNTQGNLPTGGTSGRFFIARDTQRLYYDNGSSWKLVGVESHDDLGDISTDDHHIRPGAGTNLSEDGNNDYNVVQGAGSGLNADELDGNDAAAFVLAGGDTMSGTLTLNATQAADMSGGSYFSLPSVTSDPAGASAGDMWYRSDLD